MHTNSDIAEKLSFFATLLELHGGNELKISSYKRAVFKLGKIKKEVALLTKKQIQKFFGKDIGENIEQILQKGTFSELESLLNQTPQGLIRMLEIKGLGAKRLRALWQAGISSPEVLLEACEKNQVAQIKGFGEKIQETIRNALLFIQINSNKFLYGEAIPFVELVEDYLSKCPEIEKFQVVGEFRRFCEVIDKLTFVVQTKVLLHYYFHKCPFLEPDPPLCGVFVWRGKLKGTPLQVEFHFTDANKFAGLVFLLSSAEKHLMYEYGNQTLLELASKYVWQSESEIYEHCHLPSYPAEWREGVFEFSYSHIPRLIELQDLKGTLHTHSTYSDGKHTIAQMAQAAQTMGFEYLGITDHSQSAYYAGGLSVEKIWQQHQEIEQLNTQNPHFKIFKGIESDILSNGELDYDIEILKIFDFVVASIHSSLNMSEAKATERLIRAIENPYTTIIGHPTGRLLLRRSGYRLNMPKIIDACAANNVALEINAHPIRLDLDWCWVHKAIEKGVKICINADAHDTEGLKNHVFGILVARKAGLTAEMCLNCMSCVEIATFFKSKK